MKLQYRITLSVFAILLVVGVIGAAIMIQLQRRTTIAQFEQSALAVIGSLDDFLEHHMLEADHEHIQDAVARIVSGASINEVLILSASQKVFASGEPEEVGETKNDEDIARAIESGEIVTRTEEKYGRQEFCVIFPVRNKPECHSCHGSDEEVLGAIEIGLDREPLEDQVREQTLILALIGGLTFLGVAVALSLMLRSAVLDPLSRLAASAQRIASGDFGARAEVKRNDEVGMLAGTFNEMARTVEQHADALEENRAGLEQRIRERTEQVQRLAALRGDLLENLVSAQEEERRRVARELHDETGQAISAIMMELGRANDALPAAASEARERLSQSRALAARTLRGLRELINDLRPEVLDQLGLVPALRSYVKNRVEPENIKVRLSFAGLEDRVPPRIETTLYRVIREALANLRHSEASMVDIRVAATDSMVTATITDDGKGFDVEAALQSTESWGLRGIRERVAMVGGDLSIESQVGEGTRISLWIPLEDGSGDG